MTDDAKFKKAIRARMAETGEKYTQARRALLTAPVEPGVAVGSAPSTPPEAPLPTWTLVRELLGQSLRSPAWRRTANWTIDVLEADLGPTWPVDAVERFGELPIPLLLAGGHTLAFVQTVELALRVQLLEGTNGFARTRRERRGNPALGRVLHFSLQATIVVLAQRLGWDVHLEPGRPPADLWFQADGQRITVETRVLGPSDMGRDHHDEVDRVMNRVRDAARKQGVWAHGDISLVPSETALNDVVNWISASAGFVLGGGVVQPYRQPGFDLELVRLGEGQGLRLTGPAGHENLLPRFVRALHDKLERMRNSGAGWLCVENLAGLFGLTEWAQLDMPRKVAMLENAVRAGLPDATIGGIVACSGVAHFNGTVNEESTVSPTGALGLRYPVFPWRAREAIIIPLRDEAKSAGGLWRTLFDTERDWFAWALAGADLPPFEEIMAEAD
jgi:hypothetical protein